jgi:RNA polymerase sigma-54 factor
MSMEIKQHLKLSQQLVMTPQLQQAIKLLQLSRMELVDLVREEMMENPILEDNVEFSQDADPKAQEKAAQADNAPQEATGVDAEPLAQQNGDRADVKEVRGNEDAVGEIDWENYLESYTMSPSAPSYRPNNDDLPSLEATLTKKTSLFDHLIWQLKLSPFSEEETEIALLVIGNLDDDGFLREPPLERIAEDAEVPVETVERILLRLQEFDPIGVAARDLKECLLIQARHYDADDEILKRIICEHLPNLEKKNYPAIARDLKVPVEDVLEAAKFISELEPKPGRLYNEEDPRYITPDVFIHKLGDKYFVVANDDGLPKLKISNFYRSAMSGSPKAKEYIQDKLRSAQWLIRSIQQRQRTIVRVTESIVKFQREFFDRGIAFLKPLILRDVAEDIGMHESTISRVTTNKYVHTPQGIFELKFFFNSSINKTDGDDIASEAVKTKIKEIIAKEDAKHPHSDQRLVELLKEQGIDIARRTVAKYREMSGILSSSKRRKLF